MSDCTITSKGQLVSCLANPGTVSHIKAEKKQQKALRSAVTGVFVDALAAAKNLNDDQTRIVGKRVEKLTELACFNLGMKNPLSNKRIAVDKVCKIRDEIIDMTVSVGNPCPLQPLLGDIHKKISPLINMMIGELPGFFQGLNMRAMSAVFLKRDPKLLANARQVLRDVLVKLYDQIKEQGNSEYNHIFEANIAYLLSIYPHLIPDEFEKLSIPQLIEGEWKLCDYRIQRIQLTPKIFGSPVHAFIFKGKTEDGKGAPPLVSFKGTTYPTDDGAFLSILSDLNPFVSVGEMNLIFGGKEFKSELARATKEGGKARIAGLSQGGALAQIAAQYYPDLVENIHAFNPPALRGRLANKKLSSQPDIRIFWQNRDVVSGLGCQYNPNAKIFYTIGEQNYGRLVSHARGLVAEKDVIIVKLNTKRVNNSFWRKAISIIQTIVSPIIFILLSTIYFVYRLLYELLYLPVRIVKAIQAHQNRPRLLSKMATANKV